MVRALAVAGAVLSACCAFAQSAAPRQEFEAVSIKPNKSGDPAVSIQPAPGGRFTATNITAKLLIEWAYEIRSFQLSGEPGWVDSERFDVAAKAGGNPRYDFLQPAVAAALEEQLGLKLESGKGPVDTLVIDRVERPSEN